MNQKELTLKNKTLKEIALELGLMTTDIATMIPELFPYAAPAKVLISGLKALRLEQQAIDILNDEAKLIEKKIIDKDVLTSNYHTDMLDSLFSLERDQTVEEIKFNFLKKVILVGLTKDEKGRIQAKHFFKIISELSPTELLVLGSCYHFSTKDKKWVGNTAAGLPDNWRQNLADHTGLLFKEIIEDTEENLTKRKLILPYTVGSFTDSPFINLGIYYRLTDYGFGLCNFVHEYDELMKKVRPHK